MSEHDHDPTENYYAARLTRRVALALEYDAAGTAA